MPISLAITLFSLNLVSKNKTPQIIKVTTKAIKVTKARLKNLAITGKKIIHNKH